ncbi:hypothetical protein GOP47_0005232 [Adiantum capillus-veneris]|uniref:MLO-like protein n=1 Tax=Adiantum capillus-veneris TaxID=13818 RepID=A0A9D4V4Y7_ADICA|nr:hypothetical protein GOP47_0005232 [Adiantum capillus-veneris]
MASVGDPDEESTLPLTPTWVVASVTAAFVLISLLGENFIHFLSRRLLKTRRKPLYASLEKMKEELMLLGFISLFMSSLSSFFLGICIDSSFYDGQFATCKQKANKVNKALDVVGRFVMGHSTTDEHFCPKGKEPFISLRDIHEIHRLLFVTAITHILYSCMTVALALVKVYRWQGWEQEAHADAYDSFVEIAKDIPLKRQFVFALYHTSKPRTFNRFLVWVACFVRQFGLHSVTRADYLTIRSGFIAEHNLSQEYNFHRYVTRCMEEDFTRIVGISVPLWGFTILCILLNLNGLNFYFWIALVPMMVVLAVGTKLQHVIATLAVEKLGVPGDSVATKRKAYKELFWFGSPQSLLWLLHFILFQNAFELATFLWSLWHFPDHSCLLGDKILVYVRLILGFIVQVLCSHSTLPMYALVTQIGCSFKKTMISERIRESLCNWHMDARRRARRRGIRPRVGSTATLKDCEGGQEQEGMNQSKTQGKSELHSSKIEQ